MNLMCLYGKDIRFFDFHPKKIRFLTICQGGLQNMLNIHDSCGVNNLHGMPGVVSALLSVLYSAIASREDYGDRYVQNYILLVFECTITTYLGLKSIFFILIRTASTLNFRPWPPLIRQK